MNGNRGQYTSAPMYNMKKRRAAPPPSAEPEQNGEGGSRTTQRRYAVLSVFVCAVLPLLFLAALIVPNNMLRCAFLAAAGLAVLLMWILRAYAKSARVTLTVIYLALSLVIGVVLYMNQGAERLRNPTARPEDTISGYRNTDPAALGAALSASPTEIPQENPNSAAAAAAVSAAQQQLQGFMSAWAVGDVPGMLEYVTPSWRMQQTSAETALWQLTLDARPTLFEFENVLGSDGDTTRVIVIRAWMDARNGTGVSTLQRMQILMVRSGQTWYVDPNSLNGVPIDEAAEAAAGNKPRVASTVSPTASPAPQTATSGITLYYNPDGGKYYHGKATCDAVDQRYWPLTGFSYDLLNSAQFSKLLPCSKCNPPARNMGN